MIKAVIFDMDGIIIDSEPLQMKAINQVLSKWNIELTDDDFIPMIGRRLSDDFQDLKERFGVPVEYKEFARLKGEAYQKFIRGPIEEMPGLSELIKELKSAGIQCALASGSGRWDIDLVLEGLGLSGEFEIISSGDEVQHGKPHPEIYLLTAKRLGLQPGECLALEDTPYGVESAAAAGMKCIAVPHKYTRELNFEKAHAVVQSLKEINIGYIQELTEPSK